METGSCLHLLVGELISWRVIMVVEMRNIGRKWISWGFGTWHYLQMPILFQSSKWNQLFHNFCVAVVRSVGVFGLFFWTSALIISIQSSSCALLPSKSGLLLGIARRERKSQDKWFISESSNFLLETVIYARKMRKVLNKMQISPPEQEKCGSDCYRHSLHLKWQVNHNCWSLL